jgi:hypothetical protein
MENTMRRIFYSYASLLTALLMVGAATLAYADGGRDGRGGGGREGQIVGQMQNNPNGMQNQNQNRDQNQNQNPQNGMKVELKTRLVGAAIGGITPEGEAKARTDPRSMRLEVEVEHVNLANGTVLDVSISHGGAATSVGQITLRGGEGELELDTRDGNTVPTVVSGDMVIVSNAGTPILSGVF